MLNLSQLKNVTTGMSPALPAAHSPAADATLKGKQLAKGRTKARVESLQADVDTAALAVKQAERTVGERRADDLDITAASEALRRAQDTLKAVEAALAIAIEKDMTAQSDLKAAERQVADEAVNAARAVMLAVAPRWEEAFATLHQLATQTVLAADRLRLAELAARVAHPGSATGEIRRQVQQSVGIALHPISSNGDVPSRLRKHATFTDCVKSVCQVKAQP